jgi:acyl-CoA reductase-like NAD-dependent aldehyde dehydrogenase
VLPIVVVDSDDEAIRLANDTRFGLGASVWTRDKKKGERIARQLDAGAVMINESPMAYGALEVPFGGWKESGVGQVNGTEGLRRYCHAQPIITDRFGTKEEGVWYPYTQDKVDGIQKASQWLFGTPLRWLM